MNESTKNILLTGATGLIGSHLLNVLLRKTEDRILLIIRGNSESDAYKRLRNTLAVINCDLSRQHLKRVRVYCGDLTESNFGLEDKDFFALSQSVDVVYHCAALAEFRQPLWKVRRANVGGAKNLIKFSLGCRNSIQFNYVSTAFIVGDANVKFSESDFNVGQGFNNTYERSKFEAEMLIRRYIKNGKLNAMIYRPSIVVGSYRDGITNNFRMFYQPFRTFSFELLNEIPISSVTRLNIIPCDKAASAIYLLSQEFKNGKVFHIISPRPIKIIHLMQFASKFFGYNPPRYVMSGKFKKNKLTPALRRIIEPYFPYFTFRARFLFEKTRKNLVEKGYKFPNIDDLFLGRIFDYAIERKYIKKRA